MNNVNAQVARSSFPDSEPDVSSWKQKIRTFPGLWRRKGASGTRTWRPPALHPITLVFAILSCWALIITLQLLLTRSQRENGILFAPDINALPLHSTFLYQYFPTILAVVFSIFWAWIDLETKRLEPYYRLGRKEGALGKESLLMHYPFDFVPLVPLRALRERHWSVFWASFAVVLVTWGVVPAQAGLFTVQRVASTFPTSFARSTSFIPAAKQPTALTLQFAQSTYGIVSLNETLPAYMTREYTLAPFKQSLGTDAAEEQTNATWTAPTTLYSVDMKCAPAIPAPDVFKSAYNSSTSGCTFSLGLTGNITIRPDPNSPLLSPKAYMGMYVGNLNNGFADYDLEGCPKDRTHTFYAAFTRNKARDQDPPQKVTAIFCEPTYYAQDVSATVDMHTKAPLSVTSLGPKRGVAENMFNTTWLEAQMNSGTPGFEVRGDLLPTKALPDYLERIADTELSFGSGSAGVSIVQPMVGLAMAAGERPLEDYLDWETLGSSYEKAYRLLFARAMVDVLGDDFTASKQIDGQRVITTQAVVLEPVFTYLVEGLLGVVSISALVLLLLSARRMTTLCSDPSTIAGVMSLVADNQALLADFKDLDCCAIEEVQDAVRERRYKLVGDEHQIGIVEVDSIIDTDQNQLESLTSLTGPRPGSSKEISKPVRPVEFSLWMSMPFVGLFIALAVLLAVLFIKARPNGLPLPSQNKIVQNLLENYIPTAIATLIEPMWILINRLLCLLQPIEALQRCNARAKESIDLNYSSLPPQLVVFKALSARHFVLAAVCTMALLANLLAVAFARLFFHDTIELRQPTTFQPPFQFRFVAINGSVGPIAGSAAFGPEESGAFRGGNGEDQFLIAESNYTRGTPLPAWTDEEMFYMPFTTTTRAEDTNGDHYEAETMAFGAELDCSALQYGVDYEAAITVDDPNVPIPAVRPVLNTTLSSNGNTTNCTSNPLLYVRRGPISLENEQRCQNGSIALELVFQLVSLNPNATQEEQNTCRGSVVLAWVRDPNGSCGKIQEMKLDGGNALFVRCQPRLVKGQTTVRVDSSGRLQRQASDAVVKTNLSNDDTKSLFSNDPINLIGQSNSYMFRFAQTGWHNDSFASDFINYFTRRASNSTRLLDPKQPLPTLEDVQGPLCKAHSNLFAVWLGANKDRLLVPRNQSNAVSASGWTVAQRERLFLSTPLFGIAEGILCTYAIVAIFVYVCRPGEYLARLPTSIASIIGLFAASAAVLDLQDTSRLDNKARAAHLQKLDTSYGYGSYVGADGRVHIGIEKVPFVRIRSGTTWLERKLTNFSKRSWGRK